MMLTLRPGQSIADWDAQEQAAGKRGAAGLRAMLMASLDPEVKVQQPMRGRSIFSLVFWDLASVVMPLRTWSTV